MKRKQTNTQPDIKKNYIYRLIYELTLLAGPLITTPYISRVLGAEGIGDFSFTYSVTSYFMFFAALGIASYATREIAGVRDDRPAYSRLFWEIKLSGMIPGLVCLVLWAVFVMLNPVYRLLYLALTPYLLGTILDISWFYMGLERIKCTVVSGVIVRIIGFTLMFIMVRSREDVAVYCAINAVIILAANLGMWLFLPGYLTRVSIKDVPVSRHLKEMMVYFIPNIAMSIYLVLDKTLIGVITEDPYQNGYYEQADRIISVSKTFVFCVLGTVATARMSYLYANDRRDEIRSAISKSMDFIYFLGYGAVFGLLGVTHNLVPVFFGAGYEPVEELIWLMLPLILIVGISNCLESHYYVPAGKRAQSAGYIVAGAVLNFVMNICLIPLFGAKGAVIASIAAELLVSILFMINSDRCFTFDMIRRMSVKRVIAGTVMAAAVRFVGYLPINMVAALFIQVLSGVALYCLILFATGDELVRGFVKRVSG